ncbi:hypothetical protein HDV00_008833 [Rhizophlyctis rosea]|nr:hypothetical protein HDV00_008833 [Rhizophlyctis rosea]
MRALLWTAYGPPSVLHLTEIPKPAPKPNEILIKVRAAGLTVADTELRRLQVPIPPPAATIFRAINGWSKPARINVLGQELSGVVVEVGSGCEGIKVGDEVFGHRAWFGAQAEYICQEWPGREEKGIRSRIAIKPPNVSHVEAAAVPTGGMEAVHLIKTAEIKPGEKVLVIGAAGSIGTFAVQYAKHLGAEVTGVDVERKFDTLRAIGIDHIIDYTKEDYLNGDRTYDVVIDVPAKASFSHHLLNPGGRYVLGNINLSTSLRGMVSTPSGKRVEYAAGEATLKDWDDLVQLVKDGVMKPVIDRVYGWGDAAEGHAYVESGEKRGNVVLTIGEE